MKRKRESAVLSVNQKLSKARQAPDVFELLPGWQSYTSGDLSVTLKTYTSLQLPPQLLDWCFKLCKENMLSCYQEVWGWNDAKKLRQLKAGSSRFHIAFEGGDSSCPVAYINYRLEKDDDSAVLYLYELQVEERAQRRGLGKWMLQLLEQQALALGLDKVMLTSLNNNPGAMKLYQGAGFDVDESDLSQQDPPQPQRYTILSKKVVPPRPGADNDQQQQQQQQQ